MYLLERVTRLEPPNPQIIDPMNQLRQVGQNLMQHFRAQQRQNLAPPQPPIRPPDTSNHGYPGNASVSQQTILTDTQTSHIQSLHSSIDSLQKQLSELQARLNSHSRSRETVEEADRESGKEVMMEEERQETKPLSCKVQEALRRRYGESINKDIDEEPNHEQ